VRIAVDVGALASPGNGIGRYLAAILARIIEQPDTANEWRLYGRRATPIAPASQARVRQRYDYLPSDMGRILSLCSTLPVWAALDRPDLFWGPGHRLPCQLPPRTARVVTIHDLCWLKAPATMRASTRWLDAQLMPRALAQADRVIAVSTATRDDLCAAFPALEKRTVVIHEAPTPMPAPEPVEWLQRRAIVAPYALFVGTLEPRKNLRRLLQAFATLAPALRENVQLVIAGPQGWGGERVDTEVARLGIGGHVCVLGRVDDTELATLYRHATCLAMPSLYEGFGLPLLEAMSQGTPVLTSRTASMPEVAGAAGLLVDPLEVMSIADGLARMLFDQSLRSRLAGEAQQQAARFSWARAAEETLRVFEDAVRERRERIG